MDWRADRKYGKEKVVGRRLAYDLSSGPVCAVGALADVMGCDPGEVEAQTEAYLLLGDAMKGEPTIFNDTHSHEEVLAAFDRAIELAESDQKVTP